MERYNELNETAPQIPDRAYEKAKRKILAGEFENVPAPESGEVAAAAPRAGIA